MQEPVLRRFFREVCQVNPLAVLERAQWGTPLENDRETILKEMLLRQVVDGSKAYALRELDDLHRGISFGETLLTLRRADFEEHLRQDFLDINRARVEGGVAQPEEMVVMSRKQDGILFVGRSRDGKLGNASYYFQWRSVFEDEIQEDVRSEFHLACMNFRVGGDWINPERPWLSPLQLFHQHPYPEVKKPAERAKWIFHGAGQACEGMLSVLYELQKTGRFQAQWKPGQHAFEMMQRAFFTGEDSYEDAPAKTQERFQLLPPDVQQMIGAAFREPVEPPVLTLKSDPKIT